MDGMRRLEGRRALVTGSATGIGRSTVLRLTAEGASAVVNYVGPADPANEVVEKVSSAGGHALAVQADVSNEEQVQEMFARAADELGGPVDLLVNNAGIEAPFQLVDMPLEEWNKVIGVNLTGAFLCAREAARGMVAANAPGVIVNMSSVHEVIPWERFGHYCASKGGMKLWAQTIAKELAPRKIRVVNVAPGAIATPINKDVLEDDVKRRAVEAEIPWGRFGEPEEIAAAVAWLASDEAKYVTGTTLFVDGGMTAYPGFI
ncbi:MAG: glucose 1-dehydrogenase [Thermoleophilaceae bacterium]|jgi:glucose 1-dehydrogenase|nr:glucose 1-dehydrogenase [Thermoleophilaceae bacterium]